MKRAFAMLLLPLASAVAQEGEPPPAHVEIALAEMRTLAPVVEVSGSVISLNNSQIATEVEGVLIWIAEVGDAVAAGDVIARLEPRLLEIALRRAHANVARLESDLALLSRELQRAEDLAKTNNASATLLDQSLAARDGARFALMDARAQLERAEGDLERTRIRAPFAGHVVDRLASPGEYLGVGASVLRLVDTGRLEVSLSAPIALAGFVQPGMDVDVTHAGRTEAHPVRTVVPVGDAVSRMVEIRLTVSDSNWLVGTPVVVGLPRGETVTAVAVPRDAMVERGGDVYIYRVGADGASEQIRAEILTTVGLWVGLAGGIQAGDKVIVRGAERLQPGQLVQWDPS